MIGIFDSGIGGLNILKELIKLMPNYKYIYYKDSKNNPYGEKSSQEIFNICFNIIAYLKKQGCQIIVIACNTATTKCMKKLKECYSDLIIIGTVPAIKMACDKRFKSTLVMATPLTIKSKRTAELIKENKTDNHQIYLEPCYGLANAIEVKNYYKIDKIVEGIYEKYKNKNIDSIVLGCTHYPYISKNILKYFKAVTLLDGSNGVARETKRQIELNKISLDLCDNKNNILLIDSNVK